MTDARLLESYVEVLVQAPPQVQAARLHEQYVEVVGTSPYETLAARLREQYVEALATTAFPGSTARLTEAYAQAAVLSVNPPAALIEAYAQAATTIPAIPAAPTDFPATRTGTTLWLRNVDLRFPGETGVGWKDRSPFDYTVTLGAGSPSNTLAVTPNGGNAMAFNGSSSLSVTNNLGISPATPTVSSALNSSYQAYNLVDGYGSQWGWASSAAPSVGTPQWAQYDYATPFVPTSIRIKIQNETTRAPKDFTVQGWNGTSWDVLHTVTGETGWATATPRTYSFSNTTAYSRVRFHCTAVQTGGDIVFIDEIEYNGANNLPAGEIWMVVKETGFGGFPVRATSGQDTRYRFSSDSKIYGDWGSRNTRAVWTPVLSTTTWRILRIVADGTGTVRYYLDNTLEFTLSGAAHSFLTPMLIGSGGTVGFVGQMAEVFVTKNLMDATDNSYMIGYLNGAHGLTVAGGATPPGALAFGVGALPV